MKISALSSNAFWLTSTTKTTEKQAEATEVTATSAAKTTVPATVTRLVSTRQNVPSATTSAATNAALLALQEVDAPKSSGVFDVRATLDVATIRPDASNDASLDFQYKQLQRKLGNIITWETGIENRQSQITDFNSKIDAALKSSDSGASTKVGHYKDAVRGTEEFLGYANAELANDKERLRQTLNDIKDKLGGTPEALAYTRDVFYQRSGLGGNEPVDIIQLMVDNGVMPAEEAASYPTLTLNTDSAKNQAYASTVVAEKEQAAAVEAARQAQIDGESAAEHAAEASRRAAEESHSTAAQAAYNSYNLPEGTLLFTGNEIPGIDLRGKMLAVTVANYGPNTQISLDDIIKNIRQDAQGNVVASGGYSVKILDQTPETKAYLSLSQPPETHSLAELAGTKVSEKLLLRQMPEQTINEDALRAELEAKMNAEARKNNPFHDVVLPENSMGLFQEHLPNIDLGGKMLAITFPAGTQRIDVAQTASQITQDARGNIIVPAGLKYQLIEPKA